MTISYKPKEVLFFVFDSSVGNRHATYLGIHFPDLIMKTMMWIYEGQEFPEVRFFNFGNMTRVVSIDRPRYLTYEETLLMRDEDRELVDWDCLISYMNKEIDAINSKYIGLGVTGISLNVTFLSSFSKVSGYEYNRHVKRRLDTAIGRMRAKFASVYCCKSHFIILEGSRGIDPWKELLNRLKFLLDEKTYVKGFTDRSLLECIFMFQEKKQFHELSNFLSEYLK